MLCNLTAIFQLFSLLATLSFMMLLSFHYLLVQFQFLDRFLHFKYFNWIGHAIPAIIIIVSFFYISLIEETEILESLSGDYLYVLIFKTLRAIHNWQIFLFCNSCWLSSQRYPDNIWIFIYSASGLLFGTILSCALILFRCCLPLGKTNVKFDLMLVNVLLLVLNFGIPWIAYTLYINKYFGHFAYLFIFFNAIQVIVFVKKN